MTTESRKHWTIKKRVVVTLGSLIAVVVLTIGGINVYMLTSTDEKIVSSTDEIPTDVKPDCILVLGASVRSDGQPSNMLRARLEKSLELYQQGAAPKILVSGDNSTVHYNEVHVMRTWLEERGVPKEDIFEDHAGFSTYESMYRARDVFEVKTAIVVTQEYHLTRALYAGDALGLEVWGVASSGNNYSGQFRRDMREYFARVKDFGQSITKPKPTYLGPTIPITGSGEATR
ncbi:MAG: ElyC/SanA/YdcF family protein [Actinomycetaceae bacterium]|nr:ElyC/SanA/YdcF family protein [Actinomycetaceae bacterium]